MIKQQVMYKTISFSFHRHSIRIIFLFFHFCILDEFVSQFHNEKKTRRNRKTIDLNYLFFRKKAKLTSVQRLPSLYAQTLIKSENEYRREMRRKLAQLQHDNVEVLRRRAVNDHLFAHEHLTKRYQWFQHDKTYRESCRAMWTKTSGDQTRSSHLFLPNIYGNEMNMKKDFYQIKPRENPILSDEKIKNKFLNVQPVMLEILNAPHSSQTFRSRQQLEIRKQSAQRKHIQLQNHVIDDRRYRQLVYSLQDS